MSRRDEKRRQRERTWPRQVELAMAAGADRRAEITALCETLVGPAAIRDFVQLTSSLPPAGHPDFALELWKLHFASLSAAFFELVSLDVLDMNLLDWGYDHPSDVQAVPKIHEWWTQLLRTESAAVRMELEDFGAVVTEGFIGMYNEMVRRVNSVRSQRPRSFHTFVNLPKEVQTQLADASKQADREVQAVTHVVLPYTYLFRREVFDEIRRN